MKRSKTSFRFRKTYQLLENMILESENVYSSDEKQYPSNLRPYQLRGVKYFGLCLIRPQKRTMYTLSTNALMIKGSLGKRALYFRNYTRTVGNPRFLTFMSH